MTTPNPPAASRTDLHPLLQRQLRRLGLDPQQPSTWPAPWAELVQRVHRVYTDADQDRYLLERSQALASQEMATLYTQLQASQARLANLVALSSDWVWETDANGCFTYLSADMIRSGLDPAPLIGRPLEVDLLPPVEGHDPADCKAQMAAHEPLRNVVFGVPWPGRAPVYVRISGDPVFEHGRFKGYRGVASDVTEATLTGMQVIQLARFDGLTGLANRTMFLAELDRVLVRARHAGTRFAVLFIDLDRFKSVNDSLGHHAGDELLKVMAQRLTGQLRQADMVARLGGDEFVVLADGCGDTQELADLARRLLQELVTPLPLGGRLVQISGSVGISRYPQDGDDAMTLLRCADTAMYLAKSRGKNNHQFFTPALAQQASQQHTLEGELRRAIDHDELLLHYQPKFDAASGRLCGMEALVRWQPPDAPLVMPGGFIPLAEETGLIVPLGRWVLNAACRQVRAWMDAGLAPPRCAINLSARQLSGSTLTDEVRAALALHGLGADALEVEITEGQLMADPDSARLTLQRLDGLGVHVGIDDFGTGYSSLAYLKQFPARTLKLDRSFVSGLPDNAGDLAISQAVIALAHALGMDVVAEGVETAVQLQALKTLGCDVVQGYHLGRPVPAAELGLLLAQQVPARAAA